MGNATDPTNGGTSDTTSTSTSSGSSGSDGGWTDLSLPDWLVSLRGVAGTLTTFAKSPQKVIYGVVASGVIAGALNVFRPILNAISTIIFGAEVWYYPGETPLGLADIPFALGRFIVNAGGGVGEPILDGLGGLFAWGAEIAAPLGLFAWPAGAVLLVAVMVALDRFYTDVVPALLSGVPVVGTPLARLINLLKRWT